MIYTKQDQCFEKSKAILSLIKSGLRAGSQETSYVDAYTPYKNTIDSIADLADAEDEQTFKVLKKIARAHDQVPSVVASYDDGTPYRSYKKSRAMILEGALVAWGAVLEGAIEAATTRDVPMSKN